MPTCFSVTVFGEELKASENSTSKSLNGFAAAVQLGIERQINNGLIIGVNTGAYLIGGKVSPSLCLKAGMFLNL